MTAFFSEKCVCVLYFCYFVTKKDKAKVVSRLISIFWTIGLAC